MEKRFLGNTDLEVTPITFGAWAIGGWMWGGADTREAVEAVHAAIDHGMTTIDTAPIYGFGQSEELVGIGIRGNRDKVRVFSKFGLRWDLKEGTHYFDSVDNKGNAKSVYKFAGKQSVIKECERTLARLGVDTIDLYQIHWPDVTTPVEETMEALDMLKQQGKIREAGVSNYDADLMGKAAGCIHLASNQVPYSLLRRDIENDVLPLADEKNIGVLAYSPLQRGLLTGKFKPGHVFREGDGRKNSPYYSDENIRKVNHFLDQIRPIADAYELTITQLIINWTMNQKGITSVLVGARDRHQVSENVKAADAKVSQSDLDRITELRASFSLEGV